MLHARAVLLAGLCAILTAGIAGAQDSAGVGSTAEEFEAKLGYRSGHVDLKDGLAGLEIPDNFRFIGPDASTRLLEEAWGNPPGSGEGVLGMIIPGDISPLADTGWAVVITYDEDGYVDDKGAESINYDKLLKEMQEGTVEANKEREKQGYAPVTLVGWAETPTYDKAAHKLYWAKELAFGNDQHTLNYNIRVLGRRGVLVLNAVAAMDQMAQIKTDMGTVMTFVEFGEGHRYTDFVKGEDKVAAYGIAGLVAGAVATKAGFFKVLLAGLLAAKKLLVVAAAAVVAFFKRFFKGKKEETASPPAT